MNRKPTALLLAALLVGGVVAGATAQAKPKPKGPVVVGKDAADDWGSNVDATIAPIGTQLGQELLEGAIGPGDKGMLNFIIKVSSLPANGGVPEFTRYVWTITVGDELIQLDGKWTNYTRGTCDPTAGTCPPPRDPGMGPFLVRGKCTDNGGAAVTCTEIGIVNAKFDVASGTITIPVPVDLIGAKPGTKIVNGTQAGSNFSGIWAIPSAWVSQGNMPKDELIMTATYVVPKV